jgi:hypothetical protein
MSMAKNDQTVNPLVPKIDAAVHAWMVAQIYNSPVSQQTDAYNHLFNSLPDLKSRLLEALQEKE